MCRTIAAVELLHLDQKREHDESDPSMHNGAAVHLSALVTWNLLGPSATRCGDKGFPARQRIPTDSCTRWAWGLQAAARYWNQLISHQIRPTTHGGRRERAHFGGRFRRRGMMTHNNRGLVSLRLEPDCRGDTGAAVSYVCLPSD